MDYVVLTYIPMCRNSRKVNSSTSSSNCGRSGRLIYVCNMYIILYNHARRLLPSVRIFTVIFIDYNIYTPSVQRRPARIYVSPQKSSSLYRFGKRISFYFPGIFECPVTCMYVLKIQVAVIYYVTAVRFPKYVYIVVCKFSHARTRYRISFTNTP